MYTNILRSIDELSIPTRTCVQLERTLRWVTCAKHPLTLTQLSEAVAIGEMEEMWEEAHCVNKPSSLIEDVGGTI